MGAGVEAADAGEQQRDEQAGRARKRRGSSCGRRPRSGSRAVARRSTRRAPYTRSGRTATTLRHDEPGDQPPRRCRSRRASRASRSRPCRASTGAVPPTAKSTMKASAAAGTLRPARRPRPPARPSASRLGSTGCRTPEHQPADADADERHQGDVGAERGDAAVGDEQRLDEQHDADARARPVHGPTRTAASAPPSRWPLVPAPTGKFIIWAAKTNVATRPGHRGGTVVELAAGAAQRHRDPGGRDRAGGDRGGGVEEAVGDVHGPPVGR